MRRALGRGRGGPSLLGTAARTAVVVGTASAVSGRMGAAQHAGQPGMAQHAGQPPAAPPQPPSPTAEARSPITVDDLHAQLTKLADLRSTGLLTDAEFEVQKARLLAW